MGTLLPTRTAGLLEYVYILSLNLHPILCERLPCFSKGLDPHGAGEPWREDVSVSHSSLGSENLEVDVAYLRQLAPDDTFQPVHLEKDLGFRVSLCYKPLPTPPHTHPTPQAL